MRARSVILSEPQDKLFEDPSFNNLLRGCTQVLAEHGSTLLLTVAATAEDRQRIGRRVTAGHVDGGPADLQPPGPPPDRRPQPAWPALRGLRPARGPGTRRDLLAGYREVVGHGDPELITTGDYTRASGETAMARLLEQAPDLDAVFVCSDLMAAGAITALRRAGKRVPADVAVGGFDDNKIATTDPPLTTIRQPRARQSAEMVRLLLAHIDGEEHSAVILPADLVLGDSA